MVDILGALILCNLQAFKRSKFLHCVLRMVMCTIALSARIFRRPLWFMCLSYGSEDIFQIV